MRIRAIGFVTLALSSGIVMGSSGCDLTAEDTRTQTGVGNAGVGGEAGKGGAGGQGGQGGAAGQGGQGGQGGGKTDVCGDGVVAAAEGCDDGNTTAGDGCAVDCTVDSGYSCTGAPTVCTNDDECTLGTDNCDTNATCSDSPGSFTCACNAGYSGDGVTCANDDECILATDNCDTNAICTDSPGSFTCACNAGYSGDGVTCANDDECTLGTDNCDTNAMCSDSPGSFTCACNAGYSGNGVTCTKDIPPPKCTITSPNGGATKFAAAFGDANAQTGSAIAYDAAGNMLVAGSFAGSINLGGTTLTSNGTDDVFVAKFSPLGQLMWAKSFGDANLQTATGIGVDANGNVYLTGNFKGGINFGGGTLNASGALFVDVFLAKLTSGGNHVWSQKFGDENVQNVRGLSVDTAGNVVIAGYFQNDINFGGAVLTSGGGFYDVFVAKFNTGGLHQWSRRFGDAAADQNARAVTLDSAGNVYLAGNVAGSIDFGGGAMTATSALSAFVAKLDSAGNATWAKLSTGQATSKASANAIAVGPTGEVAVGGYFRGTFDLGGTPATNPSADDAFVTLFSAAGAHTYTKTFGDTDSQTVTALAIASNGDVFAAGNYSGSFDLETGTPAPSAGLLFDGYLARLTSNGCPAWLRTYPGAMVQLTQALALDPTTGGVALTGSFNGSADLGTGMLTAAGDDVFVMSVNP